MYRKLFPVALIALFSFALTGCEEDPLSPDNPTMKAEVDGTEKETSSILALKTSTSINITGTFSDGTGVTLQLPIIEAPGTFDLEDVNSSATYAVTSPLANYLSNDGEIKVESVSETGITGTFSFTATKVGGSGETVEVTDGSFSAKFQ